jgi:hypothetical protein
MRVIIRITWMLNHSSSPTALHHVSPHLKMPSRTAARVRRMYASDSTEATARAPRNGRKDDAEILAMTSRAE